MSESILNSVKKVLGLAEDYTPFDPDIVMHINSAFSTINQLGIGPEAGYEITDDTETWDAFFGTNLRYNSIKTLVCLMVKAVFDPPNTSYLVDAMNHQIKELQWRLNAVRESTEWVDPDPDPVTEFVLDGGGP